MAAVNWIRKTVIWKKEIDEHEKKKAIAGDFNAHKKSKNTSR